jgi:hypothetical protein
MFVGPYETSCTCFFAAELSHEICVKKCHYEICRVLLYTFLMRYPDDTSCFLAVMRFPCEIVCFLLHNFRTRYPDEMSCVFVSIFLALTVNERCLLFSSNSCATLYSASMRCPL